MAHMLDQRTINDLCDVDDTAQTVAIRFDPASGFASNEQLASRPQLAAELRAAQSLIQQYASRMDAEVALLNREQRNEQAIDRIKDAIIASMTEPEIALIDSVINDINITITDEQYLTINGPPVGSTRVLSTRRSHVVTRPAHARSIHADLLEAALDQLAFYITGIHHIDGTPETPPTRIPPRLINTLKELIGSRHPVATADIQPINDWTLAESEIATFKRVGPTEQSPPTPTDAIDAMLDLIANPTPPHDPLLDLGYDAIHIAEMEDCVRQDILTNQIRAAKHIIFPAIHVPCDPLAPITPPDCSDWVKPRHRLPSDAVGMTFRNEIMHALVRYADRKPPTPRGLLRVTNPNGDTTDHQEGSICLTDPDGRICGCIATAVTTYRNIEFVLRNSHLDFIALAELLTALQEHTLYDHRTWSRLWAYIHDERLALIRTVSSSEARNRIYALACLRVNMWAFPPEERSQVAMQSHVRNAAPRKQAMTRSSFTRILSDFLT